MTALFVCRRPLFSICIWALVMSCYVCWHLSLPFPSKQVTPENKEEWDLWWQSHHSHMWSLLQSLSWPIDLFSVEGDYINSWYNNQIKILQGHLLWAVTHSHLPNRLHVVLIYKQ